MIERIVPVGILVSYIRDLLESDFLLQDVWVEGEVSETFTSRAGHVYFTMRGDDSILKCVMFRPQAMRQFSIPRVGDQMSVHGKIGVYQATGAYQLIADVVQPAGLGIQALEFEKLRQRLEAEGLFEPSRKRALPPRPRWIGVVTSAEGSVWHDIQTVMRRRYPLVHLLLAAAPVQGDSAAAKLVAALELLQADGRAELVIVARGGGSAEDLGCFNDERLVRAVFACRIPVVSAIGHETDWTMIDHVADLRAPTPSAAAELCAPLIDDFRAEIRRVRSAMCRSAVDAMQSEHDRLTSARRVLVQQSPRAVTVRQRSRVAMLSRRVEATRRDSFDRRRVRGQLVRLEMAASVRRSGAARRTRFAAVDASLAALDPGAVLRRGYAIVTCLDQGRPINSVAGVKVDALIRTRFADGSLVSSVGSIDPAGPQR